MAAINPYLIFDGNCEEAFLFYKSVFGGEFPYVGRFSEVPSAEGMSVSEKEANKIMHITLPISKETVLMGSDAPESYGEKTIFGTNISISINTDSKEEADTIFNGLSAGGTVEMPMNQTFWGAYFGMFTDKFKIKWMVNFDEKPAQ